MATSLVESNKEQHKVCFNFFFPPNIFAALYSLYLKWLVIIMCYSKGQLILQKFSAHLYRQLEVFMTTMDQLTGKRSHRVDSPSNIPASYPSPGTKGKTPAGHEEPLDSNLLSVTNTLLYKKASCVCVCVLHFNFKYSKLTKPSILEP